MMASARPHPKTSRHSHRRANPFGLGRLLIMVLTVGLLSMAHGIGWWAGLVLLGLILLAVSRQGQAWQGAWSASAILLSLAFWHQHIIPAWAAVMILIAGSVQFAFSLIHEASTRTIYRP